MKNSLIFAAAWLLLLLSAEKSRAADLSLDHLPKNGICAVIGDGQLKPWMIDLAKTGDVVIHYIAPDEAAVQVIAKAADEAGVGGKLLVEAIGIKPFPYRENLLNGLVMERSGDFNRDAALKAVAPGGKLCALTDGKWKITTRKRPQGMDIWTHNYRNAGGNSGASTDELVKFPLGLKWNDDLPFNLKTNQENSHAWTNTRAIAVVDGRIYYVTNCARENLKRTANEMAASKETQDMYLIARDAWNGTQLWRKKLGPIFYGGLFYTARAPMVAMKGKVYAVNKDQELLELDGATGKVLRTFETTFMTSHLMLMDGVMVAATWKGGDDVGAKTGIDRRPLDMAVTEGTLEAFDLASGKKIWQKPGLVTSLRGADGRVYLVDRNGADEYELAKTLKKKRRGQQDQKVDGRGVQKVIALDLKSGEILWEAGALALGAKSVDHLAVGVAGLGGLAVSKNTYAITQSDQSSGREAIWLDGATGKEVMRKGGVGFPVLQGGYVHLGGTAYDAKTGGKADGVKGINVGATVCTPQVYVNGIITANRSNKYKVEGQIKTFGAARGSCMFAAIPANGAFYTAQTYCLCAPGTVPGFISFGPIGSEPSSDEMKSGSRLKKGPAYGQQTSSGTDGWFTFMGNAKRSNANGATQVPGGKLGIEWEKEIATAMTDSNIEGSWKDSLAGLMTAPVASGGHVFAADLNRRKMVMLGGADGAVIWEYYVGGRVTTPPTIYGDLCLFGANDGYVYALDITEGKLAWKLRMGPEDRRMVSYAQLESPWAVFSSVLVDEDGIAYASAGRSTGAESGIVVRAFKPKTGELLWSQVIAYQKGFRGDHTNDVMYLAGDHLYLMKSILDRKTGELVENAYNDYVVKVRQWRRDQREAVAQGKPVPPQPKAPEQQRMVNQGIEGLANPNWTKLGNRRRVTTTLEGVKGNILAWDDQLIVNPGHAADRKNSKPLWNSAGPDEQVTAIAVGKNAVVFGGGYYPEDGTSQGYVRIVDRSSGKVTSSHRFPAPLVYQGLAIEGGKVYATFENGKLVCLGGE
ncbi:MAG: PQQ-binding-like beta-propeller repeat protein [Verrucomicrobiota bacterium]